MQSLSVMDNTWHTCIMCMHRKKLCGSQLNWADAHQQDTIQQAVLRHSLWAKSPKMLIHTPSSQTTNLKSWHSNVEYFSEINRYISARHLGFTNIGLSVSAKMADIIGLSRCWKNPVIFLTHADNNLRKKAQRKKSRQLSYLPATLAGAFS